MASIGDIVEGIVTSATDFGLFADFDGNRYLLLLHELSWHRLGAPTEFANIGDRVTFKVLHVEDPDGTPRRLGSPKQAAPDENPWRDSSVYAVGNEFRGEICQMVQYGAFVKHPAGAHALLHVDSFPVNFDLGIGDTFGFVITDCDVDSQQLRVNIIA